MQWVDLEAEKVNEIIKINKEGKKVASLEMYASKINVPTVPEAAFTNVVGQDSLTRFDKNKGNKSNKRRKNRNNKRKSPRKNA